MTSRRSRFKVVANIPTRRKPGVAPIVADNEQITQENITTEKDVFAVEKQISEEKKSEESTVDSIRDDQNILKDSAAEKTSFKRIKPRVCLPIKKQRPRLEVKETNEVVESDGIENDVLPETIAADTIVDSPNESTPFANVEPQQSSLPEPHTVAVSSWAQPEVRSATPVHVLPPLSPMKSPVRARFARPALLESSVRRHSVHASSASESEDDTARRSNLQQASPRPRKISESTFVSKSLVPPNVPIADPEESLDLSRMTVALKRKKPKPSYFVRRLAEARRDFNRKYENRKPDRSSLKMFDLIFYNPSTNPIDPDESSKPRLDKTISIVSEREEQVREEEVDDPGKEEEEDTEEPAAPVPQVKIGANGEIILDEKSLVIETTDAKKGREALMNSVPIFEDRNRKVSYYGRKNPKVKDWSPFETKCFYKALNSLGTDFALMQSVFPTRSRGELKNKFKREERMNGNLIDSALSKPSEFNIKLLQQEINRERRLVEEENRQREEMKLQMDKEKKEQRAIKRASQCVLQPRPSPDGIKRPRPLRTITRRRAFGDDFVDPCQVIDDTENCEPNPTSEGPAYEPNNPSVTFRTVETRTPSPFSSRERTSSVSSNNYTQCPREERERTMSGCSANFSPRTRENRERTVSSGSGNFSPRPREERERTMPGCSSNLSPRPMENRARTVSGGSGNFSPRPREERERTISGYSGNFSPRLQEERDRSLSQLSPRRNLGKERTLSCSSDAPSDRTESITNAEFLNLISRNTENFQQSTIQVLSTDGGVRVVLKDAPMDTGLKHIINPEVAKALRQKSASLLEARSVGEDSKCDLKVERNRDAQRNAASTQLTQPIKTEQPIQYFPGGADLEAIYTFMPKTEEINGADSPHGNWGSRPVESRQVTAPHSNCNIPSNRSFISEETSIHAEPVERNVDGFEPLSASERLIPTGENFVPESENGRTFSSRTESNVSSYGLEERRIPPRSNTDLKCAIGGVPATYSVGRPTYSTQSSSSESSLVRADSTPGSSYLLEKALQQKMPKLVQGVTYKSVESGASKINEDRTEIIQNMDNGQQRSVLVRRSVTTRQYVRQPGGSIDQPVILARPISRTNSQLQPVAVQSTAVKSSVIKHSGSNQTSVPAGPPRDEEGPCRSSDVVYDFSNSGRGEVERVTSDGVQYRTAGNLQYTVLDAETEPGKKRTFLSGLRPGSFVFMATESPGLPVEQRCSMYMIAEKEGPDGTKTFAPMPVVLPPDLMNIITAELNCS